MNLFTSRLTEMTKAVRAILSPLSVLLLMPAFALAQTALVNPLGPQGSSLCSLIRSVLNAAMLLGVPIAVLLIIYAGANFVFARGNEEKLNKAKNNFFYTILGIIIFFGAALISNVILGTLGAFGVGVSAC